MTPGEKIEIDLDHALAEFDAAGSIDYYKPPKYFETLKKSMATWDEIIEQLALDGFLRKPDNPLVYTWSITVPGRLFLANGGYKEDRIRRRNTSRLQRVQTWAIAIGTIGLLLFELAKFLIDHYHWLPVQGCCGC
jgi:hypothetical protein